MYTIQNFILPHLNNTSPENMYVRGDYWLNREHSQLHILKGRRADFGTYFNSLSIKAWKLDCEIQNLSLAINGQGQLYIEFIHRNNDNREIITAEQLLDLDEQSECVIPLHFWQSLNDGLVYFRILAISDVRIDQVAYVTQQTPRSIVKLGAVITHFNRQPYVCRAARRIENELLTDPKYKNIKLFIVDNSQNLNLDIKSTNITIIKNKNTGGSGGFTRGLLELKDRGFTHCCFMDDDASCEIESLRRTFAFFSYAKTDVKWGLSGTLFIDRYPGLVYEAGGTFYRGRCMPVGQNLNVTNINDINWLNNNHNERNYGAWCYFAFSLCNITHYSFPFFVRGDDIFFSLQNKLKIININGVCTWIDDFSLKESPMTRYLGLRGALTIPFLQNSMSLSRFIKIFWQWHRGALNAYLYGSCSAIEESVLDVLKGPQVFYDDIDGSGFRSRIKPFQQMESLSISPNDIKFDIPKDREKGIQKLIRKLTFNGLLIPSFMFKKTVLQPKSFGARSSQIFAYKQVYYYDPSQNNGFICEHNKMIIFKHLFVRFAIIAKILFTYHVASTKYKRELTRLTSEQFWRNIFTQN